MADLVTTRMRQAYQSDDVNKARVILEGLARQLEEGYLGAAASLREGLEETLTVVALGLPKALAGRYRGPTFNPS